MRTGNTSLISIYLMFKINQIINPILLEKGATGSPNSKEIELFQNFPTRIMFENLNFQLILHFSCFCLQQASVTQSTTLTAGRPLSPAVAAPSTVSVQTAHAVRAMAVNAELATRTSVSTVAIQSTVASRSTSLAPTPTVCLRPALGRSTSSGRALLPRESTLERATLSLRRCQEAQPWLASSRRP